MSLTEQNGQKAAPDRTFIPIRTVWRTINWRYQLGTLAGVNGVPSTQTHLTDLSPDYSDDDKELANRYFRVILQTVRRSRARYELLKTEKYQLKDSRQEIMNCITMFERSTSAASMEEQGEDLLSDTEEAEAKSQGDNVTSSSTTFEANPELVALIAKDVIRTHASKVLFRSFTTRIMLYRILVIWALEHPEISYKQGMNEILAHLVLAAHSDRAAQSHIEMSEELLELFDEAKLEADTYALFDGVMQIMVPYYSAGDSSGGEALKTPLAYHMDKIHNHLLPLIDPKLFAHLSEGYIMPQLYLLKWLRLLFIREMTVDQSLELWDYIFESIGLASNEKHKREVIEYISVSMLLNISKEVQSIEPAFCLGTILKYPRMSSVNSIIDKARSLQAATGVEYNQNNKPSVSNPEETKKSSLFKYFEKIPNDPELDYVHPQFSKRKDLTSKDLVAVTLTEIMASDNVTTRNLIEARGYLVKLGERLLAHESYKRRFFVLNGFVLRYYKNRQAASTMREGFIDLRGRIVTGGEPDKFEIILAPREGGKKKLFGRKMSPLIQTEAEKVEDDTLLSFLTLKDADTLDPFRTYYLYAADQKAWLNWLGVFQYVAQQHANKE